MDDEDGPFFPVLESDGAVVTIDSLRNLDPQVQLAMLAREERRGKGVGRPKRSNVN